MTILIGSKYKTKEGDTAVVVSQGNNSQYLRITFEHPNTPASFTKECRKDHILTGNVKNPFYPSIFNHGFIGLSTTLLRKSYAYKCWTRMLERCYSEQLKTKFPTYKNVTCIPEWNNFSIFEKWYQQNILIDGYELDKDILQKNCKLYSPNTCVFIPAELNKVLTKADAKRGQWPIGVNFHKVMNKFTASVRKNNKLQHLGYFDNPIAAFNVYKVNKERIIKEYALFFFEQKLITEKVYNALLNYEVDIND